MHKYQVAHEFPTLFQRPDRLHHPLYVVTVIFNSPRFRTRWELYEDFALMVARSGAILYTVEVAFGDRDWAVTDPKNPHHLQLRTSDELWLKENALNLAVARLPRDWKYVAWIDADIAFARPDWADETRHALQHYDIVQMWSQSHDMTPDYEIHQTQSSLMWCWENKLPLVDSGVEYYPYAAGKGKSIYWHSGFAWAARRSAWDMIGGLMDFCVLGAADYHMAWALLGLIERTKVLNLHPRYWEAIQQWSARADKAINRNVGVVPGLLLHNWHGPKSKRRYNNRNQILAEHQFNQDVDLFRDWQGLWQLNDSNYKLRNEVRAYFHERDEDDSLPSDFTVAR